LIVLNSEKRAGEINCCLKFGKTQDSMYSKVSREKEYNWKGI
jgi:hypothetical protein